MAWALTPSLPLIREGPIDAVAPLNWACADGDISLWGQTGFLRSESVVEMLDLMVKGR